MSIWRHLQRVRQELNTGSLETQDIAISALQEYLDESCAELFPSCVYPQLRDVLQFYNVHVLPSLGLSEKDQKIVHTGIDSTITNLNQQEQIAQRFEVRCKRLFLEIKTGQLPALADVAADLQRLLCSRSAKQPLRLPKALEKQYRALQHTPFTAKHVIPFFEDLASNLSPAVQAAFIPVQKLFWHQLHDLLQMKAVLVQTKTCEAFVTRLDVSAAFESAGLDTLDFENSIDNRMYRSCWNALQAARHFLQEEAPDMLRERSLRVACRFPNPIAEYHDTSASLLVGLKIVGDLLDLEIDSHTLVSGNVDGSGRILAVEHVVEKIAAAQAHPKIERICLPRDNLCVNHTSLKIITVQTFSEALHQYYGGVLRKKLQHLSRRKLLQGGIIFATSTYLPLLFSGFRNIFAHPVSDHDWQLWECARTLYQQKSDYQSATIILHSILDRFQQEQTSKEVVQLKASALTELGVIYLQQDRKQESIQVFRRAFDLWSSLHDKENQADVLFRIAEVYRYTVASDGISKNGKAGLSYYQQAVDLLRPSMTRFTHIAAKCYASMGDLYYWLEQYQQAGQYSRRGVEIFEDENANWSYQTCRQHLGRALIGVKDYDNAYELLESTSNSVVLQSPYYQARSLRTLSDFFFAIGEREQGMELAENAQNLCAQYGFTGQQRMLANMLARHRL